MTVSSQVFKIDVENIKNKHDGHKFVNKQAKCVIPNVGRFYWILLWNKIETWNDVALQTINFNRNKNSVEQTIPKKLFFIDLNFIGKKSVELILWKSNTRFYLRLFQ